MKKIYFLLSLFLFTLWGASAQTTVQGIPYNNPNLKNRAAQISALSAESDFSFKDIEFWVGEGENEAALVVQWNDDRETSALVWGYRWDGDAYGDDLVKAVAEADPRFYALLGGPTSMGYTIAGMGYDLDSDGDLALLLDGKEYDIPEGHYITGNTNYDYDSWSARDKDDLWQSGWYSGYWSYWVKDDASSDFSYSGLGASSRKLKNGSWDGWNFNVNMSQQGWKTFAPAPEPGTTYNSGILFSGKNNTLFFLTKKGIFEYDVYTAINNAAIDSDIQCIGNFGGYTYILTDKKLIATTEKELQKTNETEVNGYENIAGIDPTKIYLYGKNGIAVYDTENKKISGTVTLNSSNAVTDMIVAQNKAYALQDGKLSVIDTENDRVTETIDATSHTLAQDANGNIWGADNSAITCLYGDKKEVSAQLSSMSRITGTILAHAQKGWLYWIAENNIIRFDADDILSVDRPFFSCEEENMILTTACIYYKENVLAAFAEDTTDNSGKLFFIDLETGDLINEYNADIAAAQCLVADIAPSLSIEGAITLEVNSESKEFPVTVTDNDNTAVNFDLTIAVSDDAPFQARLENSNLTITPKADAAGTGSVTLTLISNGRTVEKVVTVDIQRSLESIAFVTDSLTIESGDTIAADIRFYPENTTEKDITLRSSSSLIAKISNDTIIGQRPGTTKIIVTSAANSSLKDTLILTVDTVPLLSATFDRDTITIRAGAKDTVMLDYTPAHTPLKSTTYKILDTKIASSSTNNFSSWDNYSRAIITGKTAGETTLQVIVNAIEDTLLIPIKVLENPVTGISLDEDTIDLVAPDTHRFTISVTPEDTPDNKAKWTTSDASVAKISATSESAYCTVTAVNAGTAVIKATSTDGKYTDSCIVNVSYIPLDSLSISIKDQAEIYESGNSFSVVKTFFPENASNTELTWSSSDTEVATVSTSGYVNIKGGGKATIKASSKENPELQDSITISAVDTIYATGLILRKHETYVKVGRSEFMYYDLEPSNANWRKFTFTYKSDNPKVASAGSTGYIKGDSIGDTWVHIYIESLNLTDSCLFHIVPNIDSVIVEADTNRLIVGDLLQMQATTYPANAISTVTWTSSDKTIASVDDDGMVTALKAGTTTIKATSTDNTGIIGSLELTVENQPAQQLILSIETDTLQPGEKIEIATETLPSNTTNKRVWWSSSNPEVATVSSNGTVEAVADGATVITAVNRDNLAATSSCTIYVVSPSGSIHDINMENVKAYFYDGRLYIIGFTGKTAYLYNSYGQLIQAIDCPTSHKIIEANLPEGLYILKAGEKVYKLSVK